MPVRYSDYKIKCPFYGSTRGLKIVCRDGYSYEFNTARQMEEWKKANCMKFEGCKCRARRILMQEEQCEGDVLNE